MAFKNIRTGFHFKVFSTNFYRTMANTFYQLDESSHTHTYTKNKCDTSWAQTNLESLEQPGINDASQTLKFLP